MRVLVVAEDAQRRERLVSSVEAVGQDVGGSSDGPGVMRAVRDERPEALVVESEEGATVLRALVRMPTDIVPLKFVRPTSLA